MPDLSDQLDAVTPMSTPVALPTYAQAEGTGLSGYWDENDKCWRCYICDAELTNEQACTVCNKLSAGYM